MKNIIRKILKEEVSATQEKYHKKMVDLLVKEGFKWNTPYQDIIAFLNHQIGVEGMDAFEIYQLFKDNYRILVNKTIYNSRVRSTYRAMERTPDI